MDHEHHFVAKNGKLIVLAFDEASLVCEAKSTGQLIGTFQFREINEEDSSDLLLTHCHLEKLEGFKRIGIGTEIMQFVVDCGYRILAPTNDGVQREDGSHLTEDAPSFIASMVDLKLVSYYGAGNDCDRYDSYND